MRKSGGVTFQSKKTPATRRDELADNAHEFALKAAWLRTTVAKMGKLPSRRDAEIQIEKLDRMAFKFSKKFPWHLPLSMSAEKIRRKKGPEMHRLMQQSKRLDKLMAKLWTEFFQDIPNIPEKDRKKLPRISEKFVHLLNKRIYESSQQLRLSSIAAGEGLKGIKRLE